MFGTAIIFHSIFFLIILLSKKKFEISNLILFLFFLMVAHFVSRPRLDSFENTIPIFYRFISYAWIFPQMLYLFAYTKIHSKFDKSLFYHLIPLILIFCYTLSQESKESHVYKIFFLNPLGEVSLFGKLHSLTGILFAIYYHYKSGILISRNLNQMEDQYSNLNYFQTLDWLRAMYYYFIGMNLCLFFSRVILSFDINFQIPNLVIKEYYTLTQNFLFSLTVYLFSFFIFLEQEYTKPEKKESTKYAKTGLEKDESEKLHLEVKNLILNEKLYLNEELRLHDIADKLKQSTNHISQALNENERKNFFQFINDFRVEEVIQKFSDKNYSEHSILRIALDSGFNSKSSFNKVFKEKTGKSPTEFREKLGIKRIES